MSQWSIAAERPPHLKCIAPFEGFSDLYKEILCRGGVPYPTFWQFLSSLLRGSSVLFFFMLLSLPVLGRNKQEDILAMLEKFPTYNDYWESKRGRMKQIVIPAYVLASYSTALHTFGSFRGFNEIASAEKWLAAPLCYLTCITLTSVLGFEFMVHRNGTTSITSLPLMIYSYF